LVKCANDSLTNHQPWTEIYKLPLSSDLELFQLFDAWNSKSIHYIQLYTTETVKVYIIYNYTQLKL